MSTFRALADNQSELRVRQAILALGVIHDMNMGAERYDRNANGMVLLDRLCYFANTLAAIPATERASAHYLIERELGITVAVDLENLPCRRRA
jgi:N-acetyl-anhydromuramyl-L-alanine amidase AmpD